MKDLGSLKYFLGIELARLPNLWSLSRIHFHIQNILTMYTKSNLLITIKVEYIYNKCVSIIVVIPNILHDVCNISILFFGKVAKIDILMLNTKS